MTVELTNVEPAPLQKLQPLYNPEDLFKFQADLQVMCKRNLIDGSDYGKIGKSKIPALMKPGAEKLCVAFGFKIEYKIIESTIDHSIELAWTKRAWDGRELHGTATGLYRYVVECTLRNSRGDFMGSAIGICSSLEGKYCDRPRDLENTILKMGEKRALVAVVLNTLALSGMFTQDIDEVEEVKADPRPRQPQVIRAPEKPTVRAFDRFNRSHQDYFMKMMEKHNVDPDRYDAIAVKLHGRPSTELEVCIKEDASDNVRSLDDNDQRLGDESGISDPI